MSPPLLLRIAAVLAFITCLGHTIGTFMEVPAEQTAMHETIAQMKRTMVPMPVGPARSYMQILDGNNLCTSLLLGLCGALLLIVSKGPASSATRRITLLTALALGSFSILSALHFFPVPTAFTGLASLLSLVAMKRRA